MQIATASGAKVLTGVVERIDPMRTIMRSDADVPMTIPNKVRQLNILGDSEGKETIDIYGRFCITTVTKPKLIFDVGIRFYGQFFISLNASRNIVIVLVAHTCESCTKIDVLCNHSRNTGIRRCSKILL